MDPLSDVLSLLKPYSYTFGGFDIGGDFSVQFPSHEGIKCYAVFSGRGWLAVEGVPDPVHMETGDCFLLATGRPFSVASDLSLEAMDGPTIFADRRQNGTISVIDGGGDCLMVGGHFKLSGAHGNILVGLLPPIVHIRDEEDRITIHWSLDRMMQELREPQPGGFLIAQNLAYQMLVQALRLHLAKGLEGGVGWLFALADRQIGRTITAMHEDPAHRWTLQELAGHTGMSRSAFAQKFRETVGESAMEYLTRWRMLLAGDRLTTSDDPVSEIAESLGYQSESAFSAAFKREMGCAPRRYRPGRKPNSHAHNEAAIVHAR